MAAVFGGNKAAVKSVAVDLKKEEHLVPAEVAYIEEEVKTRPIKFRKFVDADEVGGGIVITIKSPPKHGKSIAAHLLGYFHEDFKDRLPRNTAKLLSTGALPAINEILTMDTEVTLARDLKHGPMRRLLLPLLEKKRISFVETPIQRKKEGLVQEVKELKDDIAIAKVTGVIKEALKSKIENVNKLDVDKERQNFEAAVWEAVDKHGENCLIIADSLSDYKKSLDDLQEILFKKTVITSMKHTKDTAADEKENEALMRQNNQYKNKWWHNILIKLRSNNCWCCQTIKLAEVAEDFRQIKNKAGDIVAMKPQFYPIWGKDTEFRVDQGYMLMDYINDRGEFGTYMRFDWGKYEHSVPSFDRVLNSTKGVTQEDIDKNQAKCLIPYVYGNRMAMMYLVDDMAPSLLGEMSAEDDEKLWGKPPTPRPV